MPDDLVRFRDAQVKRTLQIGKGRPKIAGDLFLSRGARQRIAQPHIMPHVVIGKDRAASSNGAGS